MKNGIAELIENVVKLPTLEERVDARNEILDKLDEHKLRRARRRVEAAPKLLKFERQLKRRQRP